MYNRRCRINGVRDTYRAASCVGLQPNTTIWVLGPDLQLNEHGEVVTEAESYITWVKALSETGSKTTKGLPSVELPLSSFALCDVVKSLFSLLHDNGPAAVFTIGTYFSHHSNKS